jgi:hypothetical protein
MRLPLRQPLLGAEQPLACVVRYVTQSLVAEAFAAGAGHAPIVVEDVPKEHVNECSF